MSDQDITYFRKRMDELGVTDAENVWRHVWKDGKKEPSERGEKHFFRYFEEDEEGNIVINYFNRHGNRTTYKKRGNKWGHDFCIKRLKNPVVDEKGKVHKYLLPAGSGTYPFLTPGIIDKYQRGEEIKTLVLTEGAFKAWKAYTKGVDIIGLTSITHGKNKFTQELHDDIVEIIKRCNVQHVIWLVDGDCRDISRSFTQQGDRTKDLYERPNLFFSAARNIRNLLADYKEIEIWNASVKSENVEGSPKGLDDLYIAIENSVEGEIAAARECQKITDDLVKLNGKPYYFEKINMSIGLQSLKKFYCIENVNTFYRQHQQRIGIEAFVFHGTKYKWDEEKNECEVIVPGAAKNYVRVGDQYYEWVKVPNKQKMFEQRLEKRMKGTLLDDHGKAFTTHVKKLKAFCNVPDHENHQRIIHNCYNIYHPFEWEPEKGDCDTILSFVKHIFGEGQVHWTDKKTGTKHVFNEFDLGLDYIQLLYQKPTQMLPILCLVSNERNTGKSTFGNLLKAIFTQNMAIVGNADLANDFNAGWATKLVVACEEVFIDKKLVLERIKALSTGDKILMNAKGKDHVELDFFGKFIFMSNNEDNFIYADEGEVRYWIRKIKSIPPEDLNVNMMDDMLAEIPAFLYYLSKRKMVTENSYRSWFHPEMIKTDALRKVTEASRPTIERELRTKLKDLFLDFNMDTIMMTTQDVKREFFKGKYEDNYMKRVLKENLKVDKYHETDPATGEKKYKSQRYSYPTYKEAYENGEFVIQRQEVRGNGRPWVFYRQDFVSDEEWQANLQEDAEWDAVNGRAGQQDLRDALTDEQKLKGAAPQ